MWIVHILHFPLICDLPACHIGALKMKKIESQVLHYKCYCIRIVSLNTCYKNVDIMTLLHHIPYQAMVSENDQLSQILGKTH